MYVCPLSWEQACIYTEWIYVCICMCMRVCISTFFSNYAFQQWTRLTDGETRISETICIFQKTYAMIFFSSEMPVNQRYILYSAYNTPSIRKNIVIFGSENDCFRTKRAQPKKQKNEPETFQIDFYFYSVHTSFFPTLTSNTPRKCGVATGYQKLFHGECTGSRIIVMLRKASGEPQSTALV